MNPNDDPALQGGEWLFRKNGEVFGPVDSRTVAAMLYRGELEGDTPVSTGDGRWLPVGDVSLFVVHARKAAAALRVEAEVTGERRLRERRSRRAALWVALGALLLVAGGLAGGFALLRLRAQQRANETHLLQDFGAGISIASEARVAVGDRSAQEEDEVEIPLAPTPAPGGGHRTRPSATQRTRRPAATRPASGVARGVEGGELVAAQFDVRKIQQLVAERQGTLAPCFRAEAQRSPDFRGDVPIEFAIGNDGKVAGLWIDEPRFKDGRLRECLLGQLGAWSFPSFPGQRPTVQLAFRIGR